MRRPAEGGLPRAGGLGCEKLSSEPLSRILSEAKVAAHWRALKAVAFICGVKFVISSLCLFRLCFSRLCIWKSSNVCGKSSNVVAVKAHFFAVKAQMFAVKAQILLLIGHFLALGENEPFLLLSGCVTLSEDDFFGPAGPGFRGGSGSFQEGSKLEGTFRFRLG